jgi:hypothetical protein
MKAEILARIMSWRLQRRIVLLVPIGTGTRHFLQRGDAFGGHRMRAHISQQRAHDRGLRRSDGRAADIAAAGTPARDHGADAGEQRDDRGSLRRGELLAQPQQMAARQMAGFMREYANDLVGCLGVKQSAGIDEDMTPVHDEGVEGAVAEHNHPHVLLREPRHLEDRLRIVAHQLFDLGVADDRQAARDILLGARRFDLRGQDAGGGKGKCRHQRKPARR